MIRIFIDAGPIVGLHHPGDQEHEASKSGWSRLVKKRLPLVTTSYVLAEAVTLLARERSRHSRNASACYRHAVHVGRSFYLSPNTEILRTVTRDAEVLALEDMDRLADLEVGLVDCLSFVLLRALKVEWAFTFDEDHFRAAGFKVFPQDLPG